jgi:hypothetical protein
MARHTHLKTDSSMTYEASLVRVLLHAVEHSAAASTRRTDVT